MSRWYKHKAGFTLVELIMAIALLAFFSTMIVQIFFKAHQLTSQATVLDQAVAVAGDLADQWKSSPQDLGPGQVNELYYDKSFLACAADSATYKALLAVKEDSSGIWQLEIVLEKYPEADDQAIYSMECGQWAGLE